MAGRTIKQLEALATLDVRPYMGTYKDWSPVAGTVTPVNSPPLKRCVGQVVGISPSAANQALTTSLSLSANTAFSFEMSATMRAGGGIPVADRVWVGAGGTAYLLYDEVTNSLHFACGTTLSTGNNTVYPGDVIHYIATRDAAGNGNIYMAGTRGFVRVSGASGTAGSGGILTLLNIAALNRDVRGDFYLMRFFNTELSADEALRLYESSRVLLQPGAPKRSGIMSRTV